MSEGKKTDKKSNDRTARSFLTALFFSFNLFFFGPFDFFLSNYEQITIGFKYLFAAFVPVTLAVFAVVFIICMLAKGKAEYIVNAVFLGLSLALYVQGNYLSIGMSELNGAQYKASVIKICINLLIWAAVISIPFVILRFSGKAVYDKFSGVISFAIVMIEVITLSVVCIRLILKDEMGTFSALIKSSNGVKIITAKDEFVYSKNHNYIIILPDEFDSRCFDSALEEFPETLDDLSGFTYFKNNLGMYDMTDQAVPYMLTSEGDDCFSGADNAFLDAVDRDMKVDIYTCPRLLPDEMMDKYAENFIEKKVTAKDIVNIDMVFYKVTMLKYLPEAFKSFFFVYTSDFNSVFDSIQSYYDDNLAFYNNLQSEVQFVDEDCFKFFYIKGLHDPRNINADLQREKNWSVSGEEQAVSTNKIIASYLDILKENGIYENSTIVIMADHGLKGANNGKYPLLAIKQAGEGDQPMKTSYAPVSHSDVFATLMYLAGEPADTPTVFDIPEDQPRERYFATTKETVTETEKPPKTSE